MNEKYAREIDIKEMIVSNLREEVSSLKKEILVAKSILKDPKIS